MKYYILQKARKNKKIRFQFSDTRTWWLIRSEKPIEFGENGKLITGVDGFCHFEYLYSCPPMIPQTWTIGKFADTKCIKKFENEFEVIEFLKKEVDKQNQRLSQKLNLYFDAILQNI